VEYGHFSSPPPQITGAGSENFTGCATYPPLLSFSSFLFLTPSLLPATQANSAFHPSGVD